MKRGIVVLLVVGLFMFSFSFVGAIPCEAYPPPILTFGKVTDVVTENAIVNPHVTVSSRRGSVVANIARDDLEVGEYDAIFSGCDGDSITVSAYDPAHPSCYGSTRVPLDGAYPIIDVEICCYPEKATNLNPPSVGRHLPASGEDVIFSWIEGNKGYFPPTGPGGSYDYWENFIYGSEVIHDTISPITKFLTSLSKWKIETIKGVKGNLNKQCPALASSDPSSPNGPCPAPWNLQGFWEGSIVRTTWESSPIDEEEDPCHDVWEAWSVDSDDNINVIDETDAIKQNGPSWRDLRNPASETRTENADSSLATLWRVKSCDDRDSCSRWVYSPSPSCLGGGGGSSGGPGGMLEGADLYCNGIQVKEKDFIKRINLKLSSERNRVDIIGTSFSENDIEYCPWCYNGVMDYDEEGVDCGGSCPECENPLKKFPWWLVVLGSATVIGFGVYLYRKKRRQGQRKKAIKALLAAKTERGLASNVGRGKV